MTPVKIKVRETVHYAMTRPDIIRVNIASGKIIVDRRESAYWKVGNTA